MHPSKYEITILRVNPPYSTSDVGRNRKERAYYTRAAVSIFMLSPNEEEEDDTNAIAPVVQSTVTGFGFPCSSTDGTISKDASIDTTAVHTASVANQRPGQVLILIMLEHNYGSMMAVTRRSTDRLP